MPTYFISDLHLEVQRPDSLRAFDCFINEIHSADALYILGDFVEYWLGDDDDEHQLEPVFEKLAELKSAGVPIYFMHGNRDFLIGEEFLAKHGVKLVSDPYLVNLYNKSILLTHGDLLCTDDADYQNFRLMVRSPDWQDQFLGKTIEERRTIVTGLRKSSQKAMQNKSEYIMDVSQNTVDKFMQKYSVQLLIHGHTHRPGIHRFTRNSNQCERIVLGDWYKSASILELTKDDYRLVDLDSLNC